MDWRDRFRRGGNDDKPEAANPTAGSANGGRPGQRGGSSRKPTSNAKSEGRKSNDVPKVSAAAKAKADKAQKSAKRYAEVQRAANKKKRAVQSRRGPQDLAGRVQRDMDLKRYRELQAGADKWKDKARSQGLRFGDDKKMKNPAPPTPNGAGTGRSSGSSSGGGSTPSASASVARATSGGTTPAKGASSTPKVGRVLKAARDQRKESLGTPISDKELKAFMAEYDRTHKGTLSRSDAVLMARLLKRKGGKVAQRYGLNVKIENG